MKSRIAVLTWALRHRRSTTLAGGKHSSPCLWQSVGSAARGSSSGSSLDASPGFASITGGAAGTADAFSAFDAGGAASACSTRCCGPVLHAVNVRARVVTALRIRPVDKDTSIPPDRSLKPSFEAERTPKRVTTPTPRSGNGSRTAQNARARAARALAHRRWRRRWWRRGRWWRRCHGR